MYKGLNCYLAEVMRGERKAPLLRPLLKGLSLAYRLVIAVRHFAYDRGLFSSYPLSVPVVSIGNLVVGGTGKTPLTHLLCTHLQEKVRVGILTRGFKSLVEKEGRIQKISAGAGPLFSVKECGDEPYLLAQKTKASIWVGADRVASGEHAIREGVQCLLLDDGLQHRRLRRDVEIVVLDGNNPLSNGDFLPCGLLRDAPKRLAHADLIVATHLKNVAQLESLRTLLKRWTQAPMVAVQVHVLNSDRLSQGKAALFCGIGSPARFIQTAHSLNQEIVDAYVIQDHEEANLLQLDHFAKECRKKGARYILCTEKDAVKLPSAFTTSLEIVPVEMELKIISGKEHWDNLVKNIIAKVNP